jgi:hypothetical protein
MAFVTCATYTSEQTAQNAAIAAITPLVLLDCNETEIASGTTIPTCTQMADAINFAISTKNIAVQEEGGTITAAATSLNFVGSGVTATNVGGAVTVTVATPSSLTVKDEGVNITTAATSIDFVGVGVTSTNVAGAVTVTLQNPPSLTVMDESAIINVNPTAINFVGAGVTTTNVAGISTVTIPKPTALAHTWNALGDGSGTITLTFSDGSVLTAPMAAIPATC